MDTRMDNMIAITRPTSKPPPYNKEMDYYSYRCIIASRNIKEMA